MFRRKQRGVPKMKKISAKQQQILDYISSYSLEHGYPPSVREIGAEMGLRSPSTVHAHLKKLQEAGYLAEKVRELGPYVENADEFPERVNLQICRQIDKGNLDIEIWERGSGYTKASGTGSCAAAIAAYRKGLMENRINVNQPGGMIQIDIKEDGTIFMTGTVGYIAEMSVAESFFS